jgi:chemotaxis methyl-accepting protein methylase
MNPIGQSGEAVNDYSIPEIDARVNEAAKSERFLRKCLKTYLSQTIWLWNHMSASLRLTPAGELYGRHLHRLVRLNADRKQYVATFFLRNRAELELMRRLVDGNPIGSSLKIAVLACSKGAEIYSMIWAIRSVRPDLKLHMHAVDISEEILTFGERGIYSLGGLNISNTSDTEDVIRNTHRDQGAPIFERVTEAEMEVICDVEGNHAKIKEWLKEGITWVCGDANDPKLSDTLGLQDIVVANRFLCHMEPSAAETCLRNVARLVKPGGYIFVSGIDLDVRTKVARAMNWKPVTELIREIHDGDSSLRLGWPLEYWALEPFRESRSDWRIRYASVFQIREEKG